MECLICHKPFEADDKVVHVDTIGATGYAEPHDQFVHLWHLSALPTSGGGV